jgi:hypothetical protein
VAEQAGHATSAAKIALERRRTVLRGMHKCRGQTPFEKEEKEGEDVVAKRESRKGGQKRRCTKKKGNKREQEGPRRHRVRLAIARASPRRSACTTVPIWFKEEREREARVV